MGKRRSIVVVVLVVGLVLALSGCALFAGGAKAKPFADMNPKEKATYFMRWYNVEYDDAAQMGALLQAGKAGEAADAARRAVARSNPTT